MTNHRRCGNIVVRPFSTGDASALYATVRNSIASLSSMFPWCHPDYTITDAEARVAHCIDAWNCKFEFSFGIFSANGSELFGCVGLNQINETFRSANLGYWVGEAYRRRGIAVKAASLVASIGFEELSFVRIEIVTLPQNLASQKVAEKIGATREAEARNRLILQGRPTAAVVYSLVPEDMAAKNGFIRTPESSGPAKPSEFGGGVGQPKRSASGG